MKLVLASVALLVALAQAHYAYLALVYNGQRTQDWQHVRWTYDRWNKAPVEDPLSDRIRCNDDPLYANASTLNVTAGSRIAFTTDGGLYHPGVLMFYLGRVPAGQTAKTWDGSGPHWFKIYQDNVVVNNGQITWPSMGVSEPGVTLPASLPNGEYLIRVEHIALHTAYHIGWAQFYIACGQINVSGGGNGQPGPLVSFPGAYSPTDPGILFDMYSRPERYIPPGPAVWSG